MFTGFSEETIRFFLDLKFHNSVSYFHENHARYLEDVQRVFYDMITDLAPDMLKIDPDMEIRPYKCLSRIHRDTRFTKDKSPYRDHLWFLFRHAGEPRDRSLFFYFELGPDRLGWGMGFWGENRAVYDSFRKHICSDPESILLLIDNLEMERRKMILGGSIYKKMTVPPGIPAALQRWYLAKEFYICKENPDFRWIYSDRIVKEVRKDFKTLAPLYRLFRRYAEPISG